VKELAMRELTYAQAGVEAVADEMRKDPRIFYMSTDPIVPLMKEFGDKRIRATPIAEGALTGIAIGATRSDYYHTIEGRNYDYGTGFGGVLNARAYLHRRASLRLSYASFYINTIDGADSKHYQDAITAEGRVRLTHRFGVGAVLTQYDRTSEYVGLADVTQRSTLARVFVSTAIPRLED